MYLFNVFNGHIFKYNCSSDFLKIGLIKLVAGEYIIMNVSTHSAKKLTGKNYYSPVSNIVIVITSKFTTLYFQFNNLLNFINYFYLSCYYKFPLKLDINI